MGHSDTDDIHEHVALLFDVCTEKGYVSIRCAHCDGDVDEIYFLHGSAVVQQQSLLDAYREHEDVCPEYADDDDDDDDLIN